MDSTQTTTTAEQKESTPANDKEESDMESTLQLKVVEPKEWRKRHDK